MRLFVSDLDGTLLNDKAELSERSRAALNNLISRGMKFTIATARTYATVEKILCGLNINAPVILMNGALIRDIQKSEYIFCAIINKTACHKIISYMHKLGLYGFMYTLQSGNMIPYFEKIATAEMKSFYEERKNKYYKNFLQTKSFEPVNNNVLYFSLINKKEILIPLYEKIKSIKDIKLTFYHDVYSKDLWYLEIFSLNASKENAVNFLRNKYGYDEIICFGDNLNDISLFNASDKKYAVENARPELKQLADEVIGSNLNDGVAEFLNDKYGKDF